MSWSLETSQGNEADKIRNRICTYLNGRGLDLGCGPFKITKNTSFFQTCIGVDIAPGADVIADLGHLACFQDEHFDYVFSSHALEDFYYTEPVLREWWRKVKVGGYLILYLPLTRKIAKQLGREDWEKFYPNMGEEGANPNHKQDLIPEMIDGFMERIGMCSVEEDEIRVEGTEYSFLKIYKKLASINLPLQGMTINKPKQPKALLIRYGAIGDMIQFAPVIRLIKQQGYHVTVNCSEYGAVVLKHNPYIDKLAIQQTDIVPNQQLKDYWEEMKKHYDLFINLSGSVEDSLLFPDRKMYKAIESIQEKRPDIEDRDAFELVCKEYRKIIGDRNYYDAHLEKAGLPQRGLNGEVYFSDGEELVARDFRARHKDKFLILWSLSGSAYHKIYPYFQQVVQETLLQIPEACVISVGDEICVAMERGETEGRYYPRSFGGPMGWDIRHSLVMTKYVDLVIGSETGILNAAGCFPTPKITLLSHSKHENLCQYWENDYCLAPENTFCHPCHMLHYVHPAGKKCTICDTVHRPNAPENSEAMWSCPYSTDLTDNDDGKAQVYPICMGRGIHPERVVKRILEVYEKWKAKRCQTVLT